MIHRLALIIGGSGAAGLLAVALALGGWAPAQPAAADEQPPSGQQVGVNGGQLADTNSAEVARPPDLGGGEPTAAVHVETVYVLPRPDREVVHVDGPPRNGDEPPAADNPRPSGDRDNDEVAGDDDQQEADENESEHDADEAGDDEADEADEDHANEDRADQTNEDADHANEDVDLADEDQPGQADQPEED